MINANVIKGVQELLEEDGIRLTPGETFGNMVARELDISDEQTEVLLNSLHDGATVTEATTRANLDPALAHNDTLVALAKAVGTALGRLRS